MSLDCDHEFNAAAIKLHKVFIENPSGYKQMRTLAREAAVKESWPSVVNQFESMLIATAKASAY